MKKLFYIIMACVMIALITACGMSNEANDDVNAEDKPVDYSVNQTANPDAQDIVGEYTSSADDSTLSISAVGENSYCAALSLYRLTYIDDFEGEYDQGILTVTGTDSEGNPITAEITFSAGKAVFTFTNSTWEQLDKGTQIVFNKE